MLGPSTDERDELDDEFVLVEDVPFIASETFITEHGSTFVLVIEDGRLCVQPAE